MTLNVLGYLFIGWVLAMLAKMGSDPSVHRRRQTAAFYFILFFWPLVLMAAIVKAIRDD